MCGRFSLQIDAKVLVEYFHLSHIDGRYQQHYNIAPGQDIAIIRENDLGERYLDYVRWGLVPSWAKDRSIGNKLINARAEGVEEKPSFRAAFKKRRCLIPADGFYEWKQLDGKQPYRILLPTHGPMALAGLWEHWESPETGELMESCTILTTQANHSIAPLHDRMPVILRPESMGLWLNASSHDWDLLKGLLQPLPETLEVYPVSMAVNSPTNDSAEVIKKIYLNK